MRWSWLIVVVPAALLAACIEGEAPFALGANSGGPGSGKDGCEVGFSQGRLVSGLCNDAADDPEIAQPPIAVPPTGDDGVTAIIDPKDGSITIPKIAELPTESFLWIANTNEDTVSKVDAKVSVDTGREVRRYRSYRTCSNTLGETPFDDATACNAFGVQNPSRTAIDSKTDAWIANRAFGSQATVTKIASNVSRCVDRNGTAGIQTSSGPGDVVSDDECVLFTVPVGGKKNNAVARALAVDVLDDTVWVGLFNDKRAVRLRNSDGKTLQSYSIGLNTYGAVSTEGRIWFVGRGPRAIQRVNTSGCVGSACVSSQFAIPAGQLSCPNNSATYQYGIAKDGAGRVYVQSSECNFTHQFTPNASATAGTWRTLTLPGVRQGRGVSWREWMEDLPGLDADGNPAMVPRTRTEMWVTNYDQWAWSAAAYSYATRFDADKWGCDRDVDGQLDSTCDYNGDMIVNHLDWDVVSYRLSRAQADSPIGIGIDRLDNRYIWTANQDGYVTRLDRQSPDPLNPVTARVQVGSGPYTYSDFTGSSLGQSRRQGKASMVFAGGCPDGKNASWIALAWQGLLPVGTSVRVTLRLADDDHDGDGVITAKDAAAADAVVHDGLDHWEQTTSGTVEVNLTELALPATPYAQVEIELTSTAKESPTVSNVQLKRTCN